MRETYNCKPPQSERDRSLHRAVDTKKLEQFLGQFVNDLGATVHAGMVVIGDRLGLYKALAAGPLTAPELAAITRTDERYVREWLASQAAGGYTYNPQPTKRDGYAEFIRKVVVISGASSGIGEATAVLLAERRAHFLPFVGVA